MILRYIEVDKTPEVGDLLLDDNTLSIDDGTNVHSLSTKVVKPYGVSDGDIEVGDTVLYGPGDEAEGEIGICDRISYISDEDMKVEILPEQFNYQQLVDLQLKDGDEFEYVTDMYQAVHIHRKSSYYPEIVVGLDSYHYHELSDRLHIVCGMIDDHLLSHPVCTKHENVRRLIEDAWDKLNEAYQLIGNLED